MIETITSTPALLGIALMTISTYMEAHRGFFITRLTPLWFVILIENMAFITGFILVFTLIGSTVK